MRLRAAIALAIGAGIVLAAMVHIVVVLAVPAMASRTAFARLTDATDTARTRPVAWPEPGKAILPLQDPAVALAVCGYDLRDGPMRVRLPVAELVTTLSLHGEDGRAFYALTDRAAREGVLDLLVLTRSQLDETLRNEDEEDLPSYVRVLAPIERGIAVARVVTRAESDRADAMAAALMITCARETPEDEQAARP